MAKTPAKPSTNDLTKSHYIEAKNLFITPKGRSTFVALAKKFKNKDAKEGDDGAYCVSLCFPPSVDLSPLREAADEAGKEKFGASFTFADKKKCVGKKSPFLDAEEKVAEMLDKDGEPVDLKGWTLIRFNTYAAQPIVRDGLNNNERIDPDEIGVECYSGRWFRVMVRAKGYDIGGGVGVKFYLEGVQALSHDEKNSGGGVGDDGDDFGTPDVEDETGV